MNVRERERQRERERETKREKYIGNKTSPPRIATSEKDKTLYCWVILLFKELSGLEIRQNFKCP